jgi:menaquinone-dependent protoporphyrinogen IX oxidase
MVSYDSMIIGLSVRSRRGQFGNRVDFHIKSATQNILTNRVQPLAIYALALPSRSRSL